MLEVPDVRTEYIVACKVNQRGSGSSRFERKGEVKVKLLRNLEWVQDWTR